MKKLPKKTICFNKQTITELNDKQLHQINGGTVSSVSFLTNSIVIYTGGEDGQQIKITR